MGWSGKWWRGGIVWVLIWSVVAEMNIFRDRGWYVKSDFAMVCALVWSLYARICVYFRVSYLFCRWGEVGGGGEVVLSKC